MLKIGSKDLFEKLQCFLISSENLPTSEILFFCENNFDLVKEYVKDGITKLFGFVSEYNQSILVMHLYKMKNF